LKLITVAIVAQTDVLMSRILFVIELNPRKQKSPKLPPRGF
jgi:hypothetical protein